MKLFGGVGSGNDGLRFQSKYLYLYIYIFISPQMVDNKQYEKKNKNKQK